ncbi:MAG: DNA mismatch repair endonuclease MutL [Bdellovibrionota bacterium]
MPVPKPIRILDPNVAERIAAGEAIERPASVVKELVENALDAGSTEVCVVLEDGGKSLIEVTDNGCGMSEADLSMCTKRHATSKLSSLGDLEKITSLGFRGEALPSIAAVSDLSIVSGRGNTYQLHLDGEPKISQITFGHFLNSNHGTMVSVKGLFSQVPARLKFLKSKSAETAHVREWIERLAIAYPEAGFKLVSNDKTLLNLRPSSEASRVQEVLSDNDTQIKTLSASSDNGSGSVQFKLRFYWLRNINLQHMRRMATIVNRRAVRDKLLQQAIMSPLRQFMMPGEFPVAALFVEIDPACLDVNVHPSKIEVRFIDSHKIFSAVESLVRSILDKETTETAAIFPAAQTIWNFSEPKNFLQSSTPLYNNANSGIDKTQYKQEPLFEQQKTNELQGALFVGILFATYIVYESESELILVDQHAAHERVRYERFKALITTRTTPHSQELLIPETITFEPEQRPALEQSLPTLSGHGFCCELFGENTLLFRAIPTEWGTDAIKPRLKSLIDRLLSNSTRLTEDNVVFEILASEACHSSVRAGMRLTEPEATALVNQLMTCNHPWNCPHGRPTIVKISRSKLEEWFNRRI